MVGDLGGGDELWEPLDSESVADADRGRDVALETSVVVWGRSDVPPAFDAMRCEGGTAVGRVSRVRGLVFRGVPRGSL
jgi:hypothetical protein